MTMGRRRGVTKIDTTSIDEWGVTGDGLVIDGDAVTRRTLEIRWDPALEVYVLEYKISGKHHRIEITVDVAARIADALSR
jgi:hypothetical protein